MLFIDNHFYHGSKIVGQRDIVVVGTIPTLRYFLLSLQLPKRAMRRNFGMEYGRRPRSGTWNGGRKKLRIDSSPEVAGIGDPSKR